MILHHTLDKSNYADDDEKSTRCAQDDHRSNVLLAHPPRKPHSSHIKNMWVTEPFQLL